MSASISKKLGLDFNGSNRKLIVFIVMTAFLTALYVVFNQFLSVHLTQSLKIGLNFIPVAVAGMLVGPVGSCIVFGLGDFLCSVLFPYGAPIPLLWVTSALMGFVLGLFLYRVNLIEGSTGKQYGFAYLFTFIGVIINQAVFSVVFNTLILASVYGGGSILGYFVINLPARVIKAIITVAVQTVVIPQLFPLAKKIRKAARM